MDYRVEKIRKPVAGRNEMVALPVFPSRVFRHGYIFINTRCGISAPKDLEGKRIGLPLYTQTAAIWVRGHLTHQFNVSLDAVRWVQGAVEKAGTHVIQIDEPAFREGLPLRHKHRQEQTETQE